MKLNKIRVGDLYELENGTIVMATDFMFNESDLDRQKPLFVTVFVEHQVIRESESKPVTCDYIGYTACYREEELKFISISKYLCGTISEALEGDR